MQQKAKHVSLHSDFYIKRNKNIEQVIDILAERKKKV